MRKEVVIFAKNMEKVLKENDHKSHWSRSSVTYLLTRLKQEVTELERDIKTGALFSHTKKEAVDVANFAMMIYDQIENS